MYKDMGIPLNLVMYCDAAAAHGISARLGLGKIRHLDTHYLWLQERVRNKDIDIRKVKGDINPADLGTKHLDSAKIKSLTELLKFRFSSGRADACPELSGFSAKIKVKKFA